MSDSQLHYHLQNELRETILRMREGDSALFICDEDDINKEAFKHVQSVIDTKTYTVIPVITGSPVGEFAQLAVHPHNEPEKVHDWYFVNVGFHSTGNFRMRGITFNKMVVSLREYLSPQRSSFVKNVVYPVVLHHGVKRASGLLCNYQWTSNRAVEVFGS